jgi:major vault protein
MAEGEVVRIPPSAYIHVLDNNTNLTSVKEGPCNFLRKNNEVILKGPEPMIKIPPMQYCIILNPVIRTKTGGPQLDSSGMAKVKFGDKEIRTSDDFPDAFPLYPFEELAGKLTKIPVIQANEGLLLIAIRDFQDGDVKRKPGDTWMHPGPCTYVPKVEVDIMKILKPQLIKPGTALRLKALRKTKDSHNIERRAGEEWLVREVGHYLPTEDEEVVSTVTGKVINAQQALHLSALQSFTDIYGTKHLCGDEWLMTLKTTDYHIPDVHEAVVDTKKPYILNSRQYCYVLHPVDEQGKNQFGKKILVVGECTFFLHPYEQLDGAIYNVFVLDESEALLLKANEDLEDTEAGVTRKAGEKWMIYGPRDYIPATNIEVLERRNSIPLAEDEGLYIRDTRTGEVRAEVGHAYMLKPHETFWNKELSPLVEKLYGRQVTGETFQVAKQKGTEWVYEEIKKEYKREKHRVVSFRVPHNSAVQVFNYMAKTNRVIFGPDHVMLQPDEEFTVVSLSGGAPKKENAIQNIAVMMGPDFMADLVVVETIDHAKLALKLSYNWMFDVDKTNPKEADKIFRVPDFVGDACKSVASRVRGTVSGFTFEYFHTHSTEIIKNAVFGRRGEGSHAERRFPANNFVITNVDIQTVEPVDDTTRLSLQKSITRAIEITTETNKSRAEFAAKLQAQHSTGLLDIQRISDDVEAEKSKESLYTLQGRSCEVKRVGEYTASASSTAKARKIELEADVEMANLMVQSETLEFNCEQELTQAEYDDAYEHQKAMDELEIARARNLSRIEADKFRKTMDSIGRETVVSMARAGPEMQAKLLKGLGLKGYMVMSGKNPINLMGLAGGLMGS